jgi:S-adenosylmethionine:tRNA ribosyltransferase-isomerase
VKADCREGCAGFLKTNAFDYELPPELIAQEPAPARTDARMLVVRRSDGALIHERARDLPRHLRTGDLLVLNNTRVLPARLFGRKAGTGGRIEVLLLEETAPGVWEALCRASRRPAPGSVLVLAAGKLRGRVIAAGTGAKITLEFAGEQDAAAAMESDGFMPLPPYIRRPALAAAGARSQIRDPALAACLQRDRERYQTIYAREAGAIAAPTAGLHLTEELLARLERQGVRRAELTLHVGVGTFKPVAAEDISEHVMESERYTVPAATAEAINGTRAAGGRIVAVGSTTVRTLETVADAQGRIASGAGRSALFIYPPYRFRAVDALLTNFHLPRSTLLMLVSAFAGMELIRRAYQEAIRQQYRFYSYGDCMFIV